LKQDKEIYFSYLLVTRYLRCSRNEYPNRIIRWPQGVQKFARESETESECSEDSLHLGLPHDWFAKTKAATGSALMGIDFAQRKPGKCRLLSVQYWHFCIAAAKRGGFLLGGSWKPTVPNQAQCNALKSRNTYPSPLATTVFRRKGSFSKRPRPRPWRTKLSSRKLKNS